MEGKTCSRLAVAMSVFTVIRILFLILSIALISSGEIHVDYNKRTGVVVVLVLALFLSICGAFGVAYSSPPLILLYFGSGITLLCLYITSILVMAIDGTKFDVGDFFMLAFASVDTPIAYYYARECETAPERRRSRWEWCDTHTHTHCKNTPPPSFPTPKKQGNRFVYSLPPSPNKK